MTLGNCSHFGFTTTDNLHIVIYDFSLTTRWVGGRQRKIAKGQRVPAKKLIGLSTVRARLAHGWLGTVRARLAHGWLWHSTCKTSLFLAGNPFKNQAKRKV